MALYDNEHWLLTHIRSSFISSDDAGMCEAVLIEDITKKPNLFLEWEKFPGADETSSDEDGSTNSLDIQLEYEFGVHRQRTNTAQRLEIMEQEKRKAAKIKHVKWEVPNSTLTKEDREKLFERKEVKTKIKNKTKSMLSVELAKCPMLPQNPFNEYAKFDGNAQVGALTRTYKIFLTMLPPGESDYPLNVCVLASAKVKELIGFVCWKYLTQNLEKKISFKDVSCYGLYIAEDDGEVDWDFSYLDPRETVGKFFLTYLALVELRDNLVRNLSERESKTIVVSEQDHKKSIQEAEDLIKLKGDLTAIQASLYQSFQVLMFNKMRTKSEVLLGISGDKIDIDPVLHNQPKVSGILWRQKSLSYNIDLIVSCTLLESKSSNKSIFRIVYYNVSASSPEQSGFSPQSGSSNFKHHDFECDQTIAELIVQKINNVLQFKPGTHRREYIAFKQKKSNNRRKSFSLWPR